MAEVVSCQAGTDCFPKSFLLILIISERGFGVLGFWGEIVRGGGKSKKTWSDCEYQQRCAKFRATAGDL